MTNLIEAHTEYLASNRYWQRRAHGFMAVLNRSCRAIVADLDALMVTKQHTGHFVAGDDLWRNRDLIRWRYANLNAGWLSDAES